MKNCEFSEEKFQEAWNATYSTVPDEEVERYWKNFRNRLKSRTKRGYVKVRLAAALMILLFTSYFFIEIYNPIITVVNSSQIEREVKLSDGSLVLLKKDSEIRYKEHFRNSRGVELKGEAFFKVAKDSLKVFKVVTGSTTTKVLGTSFSIVEKEEDVEIFLYTGRVIVSVKSKAEFWALIPGESFIYEKGKVLVEKFQPDLSFKSGNEFIDVNDIDLEELMDFLANRFNYDFEKNLYTQKKRVTLRINKSDSLEEILNLLSIINNTNYELNETNKKIQILKE